MKKILLYGLLAVELYLAIMSGLANEYDDYIFQGIYAAFLFIVEIPLLYRFFYKKVATVLISSIALFYSIVALDFIFNGAKLISNRWPAENYYNDRSLVIGLLIGAVVLQLIKFVILYRKSNKALK